MCREASQTFFLFLPQMLSVVPLCLIKILWKSTRQQLWMAFRHELYHVSPHSRPLFESLRREGLLNRLHFGIAKSKIFSLYKAREPVDLSATVVNGKSEWRPFPAAELTTAFPVDSSERSCWVPFLITLRGTYFYYIYIWDEILPKQKHRSHS